MLAKMVGAMLYNYVAFAVFTVLAFLVPASLLIGSKLVSKKYPGNPIKGAPWESGEASVGGARDIDNEYLPFFSLFLPFEVITGILIVWSVSAHGLGFYTGIGMIVLAVAATAASVFGYKIIVG
ncbi:MAG: NADH-quinone oxidoreductase subunit A [Candidatus Micrarchaeota archaeon]|nr:NADH-quinone oxidoreductase subunit A [Candidatus Micrarchaeota archaeon]